MALARLTGGPLDGQVLPQDDVNSDSLIVPYGEGQVVYLREGEPQHTGESDGPTEALYRFAEATDEIVPSGDDD